MFWVPGFLTFIFFPRASLSSCMHDAAYLGATIYHVIYPIITKWWGRSSCCQLIFFSSFSLRSLLALSKRTYSLSLVGVKLLYSVKCSSRFYDCGHCGIHTIDLSSGTFLVLLYSEATWIMGPSALESWPVPSSRWRDWRYSAKSTLPLFRPLRWVDIGISLGSLLLLVFQDFDEVSHLGQLFIPYAPWFLLLGVLGLTAKSSSGFACAVVPML